MPGRLLVLGDSLCSTRSTARYDVAAFKAKRSAFLRQAERPARPHPSCSGSRQVHDRGVAGGDRLGLRYRRGRQGHACHPAAPAPSGSGVTGATCDPSVNAAFLRVLNMIDGPRALFRPGTGARPAGSRRRAADGTELCDIPGEVNRYATDPPFTITTPFGSSTRLGTTITWRRASSRCWNELHGALGGSGRDRVLDVGCGGGSMRCMVGRRPDLRVTAWTCRRNWSPGPAVGREDRRADQVEFVQGERSNWTSETRTSITCMRGFHQALAGSATGPRGMSSCAAARRSLLVMEADRSCRFSDVRSWARTPGHRGCCDRLFTLTSGTYIAGQSLDLDDARALWNSLPLDEVDGPRRIPVHRL